MTKKNGTKKTRKQAEGSAIDRQNPAKIQGFEQGKSLDILENIDTSYFELDLNGNFTFCNDIVCRDLGYCREDIMGMNFSAFTKPECMDQVRKAYQEIYRTGKPNTLINIELLKKDGSTMFIEQSASVLKGQTGEVIGFRGVSRDVTERVRAEQALRRSEEKYRRILETIEDGYYETDLKGNFTFFNNAGLRNSGYEPEELMGINFRTYTTPRTAEFLMKTFNRVYETGMSETLLDYEVVLKNGTVRYHEMAVGLLRNDAGQPSGFHILARDITERKKAEEALKKNEEKYRTFLEEMGEGYIENDLKGNLTFINDAGCKLLGYTRDELLGMSYLKYHRPVTAVRMKEIYQRIYRTGQPALFEEFEVVLKDGSTRFRQLNATLARDPSGRPTGFRTLVRDVTKRKKAEQALRESEEKYRTILETMGEGIFETDLRGNYTFVNDAACRLVGYERDEMIGNNFRMCHSPGTMLYLKEAYTRMYKTGKSEILMDYEAIRKDGSVRIHQANTALIRDHAGDIIGSRALVRDVTERKKAEESLRKSEEKYRTILETMEEAYVEIDLKGRYTFVNDAACRLVGRGRDEFIGIQFRDIFAPRVAHYLQEVYGRILNTGNPEFLIDHEMIHKDGSVRNLEANVALIRDASGKSIGFRTLARDITQRKQAEEALKKSEERYRSILETMDEMYTENDLKGKYTFVNDAAWRLMGYNSPDELMERKFHLRHPPETIKRLFEVYSRVYKTGKPEFISEYEVFRKDGSIRINEASVALMKDASGEPVGFRTLARDVTERKKTEEEKARIEEQLAQAQKMESVGRLAGGVAHDFNNMLTVILGYAELIKSRLPRGDPMLADMLEIEKAAGRSRDLTHQLLAFSRKEIIEPRSIDLNGLIKGAQKMLARLIEEDIDLRFYPGTDLWKIRIDPSQMEHLLINLAANARDAISDRGKLTIETENVHLNEAYCKMHPEFAPGYYVLLGVSDDGIGMDKETMKHLFEPFFTTKETGRGTGLGLATAYGIVKQNDGFINVYSEPGRGTTFKIYIPKSMEEEVAKDEAEEAVPAHTTGTVLLVEDDDLVRAMTTEMLEVIGYTVIATGTPEEALSFFEKDKARVDLLLTDVVMPQMSGRELSERIESIRPGVKVLFMSGYTTNVIAHRGVLDEGVHFIQKPFSMSDLARKVRDALNER